MNTSSNRYSTRLMIQALSDERRNKEEGYIQSGLDALGILRLLHEYHVDILVGALFCDSAVINEESGCSFKPPW